jgi:CelD/BcsL family acetyltransferase involved in cellulose biosynthesis
MAVGCATLRGMTISLLHGSNAFRELEPDWRKITAAAKDRNPFLTWEWVSEWAHQFSGASLLVAVVRDGTEAVAIAPFHRRRYGLGPGLSATALQLLSPVEVEHLFEVRDVLTRPGWEESALGAILDHLAARRGWDWIRFAAQGRNLGPLERILEHRGSQSFVSLVDISAMPVMTLASTWTEQRASLKRNIKESIRRSYNSLARQGIGFEFVVDEAAPPQDGWLDEFFRLHHERAVAKGRAPHPDHFQRHAVRAGIAAVLGRAGEAGHLRVFMLRVDGRIVAIRLGLEVNGCLYLYYSGFDPTLWRYSVMTLLVTEIVKWAIDRRLEALNHSPGIDVSKTRWGTQPVGLKSFVLVNRSIDAALKWKLYRARKFASKRLTTLYFEAIAAAAWLQVSGRQARVPLRLRRRFLPPGTLVPRVVDSPIS